MIEAEMEIEIEKVIEAKGVIDMKETNFVPNCWFWPSWKLLKSMSML